MKMDQNIGIKSMKLWLMLSVCAVAAAAPKDDKDVLQNIEAFQVDEFNANEKSDIIIDAITRQVLTENEDRSVVVNMLIRQLFAYIRFVINNGSAMLDLPPLDPLELDELHLYVPAGLVNMDLHLKNVLMTGLGGFVVHRSNIRFSDLSFDIDISVPKLHIKAEQYDFVGDLFSAIPLFGEGGAEFVVENFRFRALLFLKQSEDGKSVLLDRIENPSFKIPSFKSNLDGVIGGGNIDAIVNAIIEEVIIDYINRFQGAISRLVGGLVVTHGNPILDQLDTWRFIEPFV